MPNHCYNTLKVKKGANFIKELLRGKKPFSNEIVDVTFNNIFNMDKDVDNPKYQNAAHLQPICSNEKFNWYDWSCIHWGTKWDAYDTSIKDEDGCCVIDFCTAWGPPGPIIDEILKRCIEDSTYKNNVEFTYHYIVEGEEQDHGFTFKDNNITDEY